MRWAEKRREGRENEEGSVEITIGRDKEGERAREGIEHCLALD